MNFLESVYIGSDRNLEDFRFPVQFVSRPNLDFRGFCGTLASGIIRKGDEIMVLPSKRTSRVKRIVTFDGDLEEAFCPQSVTLVLEDEVDCSRGDMIVRPGNVPKINHQFDATLVWMSAEPMVPGKSYLFKHTSLTTIGQVDSLRYRVDVNNLHRSPAPELQLNEIGRCSITVNQPFFYDAYRRNKTTGSFIVVDRISNITVAAGMISDRDIAKGARIASWERVDEVEQTSDGQVKRGNRSGTNRSVRSASGHAPFDRFNWFGKIIDCQSCRKKTLRRWPRGSSARRGNDPPRYECRSWVQRRRPQRKPSSFGPVSTIAQRSRSLVHRRFRRPQPAVRDRVADVIGRDRFAVVYLTAPLSVREQRDSKGYYRAAAAGQLPEFANVLANYEPPQSPDLELDTDKLSVNECVDQIVELLRQRSILK